MESKKIGRREYLKYMGAGAAITAAAIGVGYGLYRAMAPPPAKKTLEVWTYKMPLPDSEELILSHVMDFGAEYGITTRVSFIPWEDLYGKVVAAVEAGAPPDVILSEPRHTMPFVRRGLMADTTSVVDDIGRDKFIPALLELFKIENKYYGVPFLSGSECLFVREDWCNETGVPVPSTMEEIATAAEAMTRTVKGEKVYGFGQQTGKSGDGCESFHISMIAAGGSLFDEDGNITFDSPATRSVVKWWADMYNKGHMPPGSPGWSEYENNAMFQEGIIGMTYNAQSIVAWLLENNPDMLDNVVCVPNIHGPGGDSGLGYAWGSGVFEASPVKDIAFELIKWLVEPKRNLDIIKASYLYFGPALISALDDPIWHEVEDIWPFIEAPKYSHDYSYKWHPSPEGYEVMGTYVYSGLMARVLVDKWSIDDAMKEAVENIKHICGK